MVCHINLGKASPSRPGVTNEGGPKAGFLGGTFGEVIGGTWPPMG